MNSDFRNLYLKIIKILLLIVNGINYEKSWDNNKKRLFEGKNMTVK